MRALFLSTASALLCLLGACTIDPGNGSDPANPSNPANSSNPESASNPANASNPGHASTSASAHAGAAVGGAAGNDSLKDDALHGAHAGAAGEPDPIAAGGSPGAAGGSAGTTEPDPSAAGTGGAGEPPPPCDLKGNCGSNSDATLSTCGVVPGNECEFTGFIGATAEVGLGQHAVIGTACCGACGCVPVEVYYDGRHCWQGIPQCDGQLLVPHSTTSPNPSFTPPSNVYGSFYLGSAGFGSGGAAGGSPATSSAGSGGDLASAGTASASRGGSGGAR